MSSTFVGCTTGGGGRKSNIKVTLHHNMPRASEQETEPLLQEDELPPVYSIIHQIRRDVITCIDTPLNYADLTGAELTYSLVKPLEDKYNRMENMATVFCFLVNRVHFTRDQNFASASLNRTRGLLCEILATRTIRRWSNLIELAHVLITSWPIFEGCSDEVLAKGREIMDDFNPKEKYGNAIEMAIISDAKLFVKSAAVQKVVDAIWGGKIVYSAESSRSLLRDVYKRTPIQYYDPRRAPLLDHYRLKVPAIRSVLEYGNFLILFVFFVIALEFYELETINVYEKIFMVYASGFCLEKLAAMQEHGLRVYIHGTWNGFDVAFIGIFVPYLSLRIFGIMQGERWALVAGMDCLALAACLLFPRLAFVTLSNNLMVLAFRAMFAEFAILISISVFCFAGFLYCLWTLSRGGFNYSPARISWWLLDLYFGLDATGFERATTFHPIFGPVLMVTFACLSNTLLLTVLVSILSHTFSTISSDADAEAKFRRAVATIEGVKADALFSYLPPMNLVAFVLMYPASFVLSPRWFHKVNVFMIRIAAAPVLLCVAMYERHTVHLPGSTFYDRISQAAERVFDSLPRRLRRMTIFESLGGSGRQIDALFLIEDEINQSALDTDEAPLASEYNVPHHEGGPTSNTQASRRSVISHNVLSSSIQGLDPKNTESALSVATDVSKKDRRRSAFYGLDTAASPIQPSPLAQIYQPVVLVEENAGDQMELAATSSSFGPRRRLASMTRPRRPSIEPFQASSAPSQPIHPHFHSHPARPGGPPPAEHMDMPTPPTTVLERAEEVPSPREVSEMSKRLIEMEVRQQRIENLLVALAGELRTPGNRPSKVGS